MPAPRYFSIPSTVVGAVAFRNEALNWTPCVRSLIQDPLAWTNSLAEIIAAWPTRVMRSRWPRALTRRTQKPLSGLWNVTRSTKPPRTSVELAAKFLTWTEDNLPRQVVYEGLREDKPTSEVRRGVPHAKLAAGR